jgi:hypothetical protein
VAGGRAAGHSRWLESSQLPLCAGGAGTPAAASSASAPRATCAVGSSHPLGSLLVESTPVSTCRAQRVIGLLNPQEAAGTARAPGKLRMLSRSQRSTTDRSAPRGPQPHIPPVVESQHAGLAVPGNRGEVSTRTVRLAPRRRAAPYGEHQGASGSILS